MSGHERTLQRINELEAEAAALRADLSVSVSDLERLRANERALQGVVADLTAEREAQVRAPRRRRHRPPRRHRHRRPLGRRAQPRAPLLDAT